MTASDFIALLPLLVTAYAGVILMGVVAFIRSHAAAFWCALVSLAAAFACVFVALNYAPRNVTQLIKIDAFSLFFTGLVIAGAIPVAMLSRDYLDAHEKRTGPFYVLLLFAVTGMAAVVSSSHFVSFFLGYETLSVSLFGLIGYTRRFKPSLEAAIKYLILAATSSAFLLFGIALLYANYGSLQFEAVFGAMRFGALSVTAYFGLGLALVGIGFKLAVVPFHMWSPDVYQGAPAPVTALIATGSKAAVFALLLKLIVIGNLTDNRTIFMVLAALATATMFAGNLLALMESNIKRLLAYSSIAQIGYLFIPLLAGGELRAPSIAFYFVSYFATTIAAFGVISALSAKRKMGDMERIADYRGLMSTRPAMAAVLMLSMLSLMGLPLTSGFFAKLYIFSAAAKSGLWWLLFVGVVNTGISAFYYLRVVFSLFGESDIERETPPALPASAIVLTAASATILFFGIYPTPLFWLAQVVMKGF